jgi:protein TonB
MLNTKLNLYNPDWIELVFTNRNKNYGAFELRRHYGSRMVKAMLIGFTSVIAIALLYDFSLKKVVENIPEIFEERVVKLNQLNIEKPVEPKLAAIKPQPKVTTQKYTSFVVTNKPVTEDPPVVDKLIDAIGPANVKGDNNAPVDNPAPVSNGSGNAPAPVVDNTEHTLGTLEVMPEPVGGTDAWSKFLNRNLRFPSAAQEAGISGRVIVSFVIEKDGRLTDITVVRGAGYGMDEEASRVLKLAKPWKPGKQNGNPVRVRYTIPMNFQLTE